MHKSIGALGLGAALVVAAAAPALAHVTAHTLTAPDDGYVTLAFQVPNEDDTAATVKLEVTFPGTPVVPNASVEAVPGWTTSVRKTGDHVTSVTWTGGRIEPGQFQLFPVSMGQLPDGADSLTFKAVQTFDNGDVVNWIEEPTPGGDEPEHPAPVLDLTAAAAGEPGTTGSDSAPVAAYAVSAAALALSVVAFRQSRRTPG
jgi:uncharacterized protein YcnI